MSQWGWVLLGWSVTVAVLAVYAWTLLLRGRRLSRRVSVESQRWMESGT